VKPISVRLNVRNDRDIAEWFSEIENRGQSKALWISALISAMYYNKDLETGFGTYKCAKSTESDKICDAVSTTLTSPDIIAVYKALLKQCSFSESIKKKIRQGKSNSEPDDIKAIELLHETNGLGLKDEDSSDLIEKKFENRVDFSKNPEIDRSVLSKTVSVYIGKDDKDIREWFSYIKSKKHTKSIWISAIIKAFYYNLNFDTGYRENAEDYETEIRYNEKERMMSFTITSPEIIAMFNQISKFYNFSDVIKYQIRKGKSDKNPDIFNAMLFIRKDPDSLKAETSVSEVKKQEPEKKTEPEKEPEKKVEKKVEKKLESETEKEVEKEPENKPEDPKDDGTEIVKVKGKYSNSPFAAVITREVRMTHEEARAYEESHKDGHIDILPEISDPTKDLNAEKGKDMSYLFDMYIN